jgi:hypothetical protein
MCGYQNEYVQNILLFKINETIKTLYQKYISSNGKKKASPLWNPRFSYIFSCENLQRGLSCYH